MSSLRPHKAAIKTGMPLNEMLQDAFYLLTNFFGRKDDAAHAEMNEAVRRMLKEHEYELSCAFEDRRASPCIRFAQPSLRRWIGKSSRHGQTPIAPLHVGLELWLASVMAYKNRAFGSAEDEFGHWWLLAENYKYHAKSFLNSICVHLDATLFSDRYIVTIGEKEDDIIHRYEIYEEC